MHCRGRADECPTSEMQKPDSFTAPSPEGITFAFSWTLYFEPFFWTRCLCAATLRAHLYLDEGRHGVQPASEESGRQRLELLRLWSGGLPFQPQTPFSDSGSGMYVLRGHLELVLVQVEDGMANKRTSPTTSCSWLSHHLSSSVAARHPLLSFFWPACSYFAADHIQGENSGPTIFPPLSMLTTLWLLEDPPISRLTTSLLSTFFLHRQSGTSPKLLPPWCRTTHTTARQHLMRRLHCTISFVSSHSCLLAISSEIFAEQPAFLFYFPLSVSFFLICANPGALCTFSTRSFPPSLLFTVI